MRPLLTAVALLALTLASPFRTRAQSAAPNVAPCTATQLSIALDDENGFFNGMSHSGTLLVIRNLGTSDCTVPALPRLTFEDAAHRPVAISPQPLGGKLPGPVVIPVGAEVTGSMRWVAVDAYGAGNCVSPAFLILHLDPSAPGLPDTDTTLRTAFTRNLCGPAHQNPGYTFIPLHRDPAYTPHTKASTPAAAPAYPVPSESRAAPSHSHYPAPSAGESAPAPASSSS